jgi:hypothetical protein
MDTETLASLSVSTRPMFDTPMRSGSVFRSGDAALQRIYDLAAAGLRCNTRFFNDRLSLITEGAEYPGAYLESAPNGGAMYAKFDPQIALNHQAVFFHGQRSDGRLPAAVYPAAWAEKRGYDAEPPSGHTWVSDLGILATYNSLGHDYDLPETSWRTYFWAGRDRAFLEKAYSALAAFDAYLWKHRDSDGDGVLETWCTWDTGEDNCTRLLARGAPSCWPFDHPPFGESLPDPQDPAAFKSYWIESHERGDTPPRREEVRVPFASMDIMAWSYEGRAALAKMARELGNGMESVWDGKAGEVRQKVEEHLWDPSRGACFDSDREGVVLPELVHNNIRAMHHGLFTQDMADAFVSMHLLNPDEFWTYAPLPSISVKESLFLNDPVNNWSGQAQGLTYQRAIRALENYGHFAEVSLIGEKLFHLLESNDFRFPQQFDPFTGAAGRMTGPPYSPMMFAALEYMLRLHGVHLALEEDQVWWSCLDGRNHEFEHVQVWAGRTWKISCKSGVFTGEVDGRECFSCTTGCRVITGLDGRSLRLVGLAPSSQECLLKSDGHSWSLVVAPNEVWELHDGRFRLAQVVPFTCPPVPQKITQ